MRDMSRLFVGMALLGGCQTGDIKLGEDSGGTGADSGGTNTTKVECKATLVGNVPEDGAVDVAFTTPITFTLSEADDTAKITTSIPGTQTVLEDGVTVAWQPSGSLDAETGYEVKFDWCGGSTTVSFKTAASFAEKVESNTYALELQNASIDKPAGVGGMLSGQLPEYILMGVLSADSSGIQFMGALAEDGSKPPAQDVCSETLPFPVADFGSQPAFSVGPQDTLLAVGGYEVTLFNMTLTGTFSADGSSIEDGTLDGSIDAREIASAMGYSADQVCSLLGAFGSGCEACPSDGEAYCIELAASKLRGDVVSGLTLVEVTNPTCLR